MLVHLPAIARVFGLFLDTAVFLRGDAVAAQGLFLFAGNRGISHCKCVIAEVKDGRRVGRVLKGSPVQNDETQVLYPSSCVSLFCTVYPFLNVV